MTHAAVHASKGAHKGAIIAEDLVFAHGSTTVLGGLSFTVAPGEHVAVIGRSGTGKSTLLNLLAGITRPARGRVLVDGHAPGATSGRPVLMFQRPALLPWLTAYDNVLIPLRFSGALRRAPAQSRGKVDALFKQLGLQERAQALPVNLSGGQQHRVALARALAADTSVLLLDEPFSALDSETRTTLRRDIRALARANRLTLITVTHDLADAAAMADRVLLLDGRPARLEDDFALGADPERSLRLRLSHLREVA
jgi:NitT/TauT family transport system ATP-binding protein